MPSLYIHIPFCEQKCFYCSFVVFVGQRHRADDYLDCLSLEAKRYKGTECASVFLGGGTPSYLETDQLKRLFRIVEENFSVSSDAEYTIEANPGSLDAAKLETLRSRGINRISLGVQSFHPHYLKYLGRNHDQQKAGDT
ncbi:MAG: radical SAM protein, partial [Candidatus Omnitrophica bacterium]|nr:radical SAM protein [Candidatus Omnitrophota bacterium]